MIQNICHGKCIVPTYETSVMYRTSQNFSRIQSACTCHKLLYINWKVRVDDAYTNSFVNVKTVLSMLIVICKCTIKNEKKDLY